MSQPLIMSFRPDAADMCLDGTKTETRRIPHRGGRLVGCDAFYTFDELHTNGRKVWKAGETAAIKRTRMGKAVGRVFIVSLEMELLQAITEYGAIAEGMTFIDHGYGDYGFSDGVSVDKHGDRKLFPEARDAYKATWDRLVGTRGKNAWDANPMVVVIRFQPDKVRS